MSGNKVAFIFIGISFALLQVVQWASCVSLYNRDDPMWQLNSANFDRVVYGKSNAFIIQFYASWCGYSKRFAPEWQEFARDVENWKNVIEVAVVNCDTDNGKRINLYCKEYNIPGVPTIKLFPAYANATNKGKMFYDERELPLIRQEIIDFLQSERKAPSQLPDLLEVESDSVSSLWRNLSSNVDTAYLIIEPDESYLGREVILDLSSQKHLTVKLVLSKNTQLLQELSVDFKNTTQAIFLKIKKDGGEEILNVFDDSETNTAIRDLIFETLTGKPRVKEAGTDEDEKENTTVKNGVYMADLENAVRYALRQEVAVQFFISGEEFTALKNFITSLSKYFPGSPAVEGYLIKLNSWMDQRYIYVFGHQFANVLDSLQTETEYLPEMQDYVGCKSSKFRYRGYPCSLWTLFHTLTVQAYRAYEKSEDKSQPPTILDDIRGYIEHFFSCRGCFTHFQKMSENLMEEINTPKDAVLWLWQVHNKINEKLASDLMKDPRDSLKTQFPSQEACPKCRLQTQGDIIEWDHNEVMLYLQHFYKIEDIMPLKNSAEIPSSRIESIRNELTKESQGSGSMLQHFDKYFFMMSFLPLFRYITDV